MIYKKRNRPEEAPVSSDGSVALRETELVLKLKKGELFDPHVLLPHAELNDIVYHSVDVFVGKYKGTGMTLSICSDPVSPMTQDVFREVYRAHYRDELSKVNRYLHRHYVRIVVLMLVAVLAFFASRFLTSINPSETVFSYVILNISGFCIWEVGYTQFATRNVLDERRRILRALNAEIAFQ